MLLCYSCAFEGSNLNSQSVAEHGILCLCDNLQGTDASNQHELTIYCTCLLSESIQHKETALLKLSCVAAMQESAHIEEVCLAA